LKRVKSTRPVATQLVAPFTGAWIETLLAVVQDCRGIVAPFTGAWIETFHSVPGKYLIAGRTLHGCVD